MRRQESKHEKFEKVTQAALEMASRTSLSRSLSQVTHTRLSKMTGVSRSWIYKYIGSTPESILISGINHFGSIFIEVDRPANERTVMAWIRARTTGFETGLRHIELYPWLLPFYFRYRETDTEIGRHIQHMEAMLATDITRGLKRLFGMKSTTCDYWAEVFITISLGLLHRWSVWCSSSKKVSEVKREARRRFYVSTFRGVLTGMSRRAGEI